MDLTDFENADLLSNDIAVSDKQKVELTQKWEKKMKSSQALYACASCGRRDPTFTYTDVSVIALPAVFRLTTEQLELRERLGFLQMLDKYGDMVGPDEGVDLRPLISCYQASDGFYYHLHPELVDSEMAKMCQHCSAVANKADAAAPPKLSIAAGHDFGLLTRIKEFAAEPLSEVERILLSDVRLYHVVVKV